ncbi:MAG TPA: tetratricopeptide repeat protein [Pseudonocardiaceae bacterium]
MRHPLTVRLRHQVAVARRWRQGGDYRQAGLLLTLTLSAAEAQFGGCAELVAEICNELGVLGKYTGRFEQAETFYRRALHIYQDTTGVDSDAVATIYHNLGGIAHARGRYRLGEPLARRAVEIRTRLHGPDHPVVAADAAAWAALLVGCGRLDEAEVQLCRALPTLRHEDYERAVTAHNLAALVHHRNDLHNAILGYTEALRLKERVLGANHPDLAITLVNLAGAFGRLDQLDAARSRYTRAVSILSPVVESDHPTLVAARTGLSRLA